MLLSNEVWEIRAFFLFVKRPQLTATYLGWHMKQVLCQRQISAQSLTSEDMK